MVKIKKQSKKLPIIILAFLLLLVVGSVLLYRSLHDSRVQPGDSGPTTAEKAQESAANADGKKQIIDSGSSKDQSVPQGASASATSKSIELSAQQEANNTVTVFTKLVGYSSGSCVLTATNGTKSSTQQAELVYQREYSSCAGFSVPITPLGKGMWNLKLTVTSNGTAETKSISFEVK